MKKPTQAKKRAMEISFPRGRIREMARVRTARLRERTATGARRDWNHRSETCPETKTPKTPPIGRAAEVRALAMVLLPRVSWTYFGPQK